MEFKTSPFDKDAFLINYDEGDKALYRNKLEYKAQEGDSYYVTNDGDTLEGISFEKYGTSKLWWIIADVNDSIIYPFNLDSGLSLLIPNRNNLNV